MSLGGEAAHIDTDLGDDGLRGHDVDAIDLKLLETLREYWRWMEPRTYLFPGTVRNWRADVPVTEKIVWTAVAEAVQHLKELGMELSPQTADSFLLPIEDDIVLMAAVISNIKQLTVELERLLAESAETLLRTDTVQEIHYFTARVSSRPYNPTGSRPRAVYPSLQDCSEPADHVWALPDSLRFDVPHQCDTRAEGLGGQDGRERLGREPRLSSSSDAFSKKFEVAVLIRNDSDLAEPVRIIAHGLGLPVGILNPHQFHSRELRQYATFLKRIRQGDLVACQFPRTITDRKGTFAKPAGW